MDRPIAPKTLRLRLARKLLTAAGLIAATVVLLILIIGWMRPSICRDEIRIGPVTLELIEDTIAATGSVVPEYEHVIVSPCESRVTRILKKPGAKLVAGDSVVLLDVSAAQLVAEKLDDQIALKGNDRDQAHLDMADETNRLRGQYAVKELELRSFQYEADRARNYHEDGLFSQDEVRCAENDEARAKIELAQLKSAIVQEEKSLAIRLARLDLELGILEKERDEAARNLQRATATAGRDGVLTWVLTREGAAVHKGDEVARIADLSSFRVEATVSDIHAQKIKVGQDVAIVSAETRLAGRVSAVRPLVENGIITLDVELEDRQHAVLRHNLRVEVYIITARQSDAVCVPRGQYPTVDGVPMVFVLRGDRAVRTPVRFGLRNYEKFQVVSGLVPGDEVIITDMRDHQHVREVRVK